MGEILCLVHLLFAHRTKVQFVPSNTICRSSKLLNVWKQKCIMNSQQKDIYIYIYIDKPLVFTKSQHSPSMLNSGMSINGICIFPVFDMNNPHPTKHFVQWCSSWEQFWGIGHNLQVDDQKCSPLLFSINWVSCTLVEGLGISHSCAGRVWLCGILVTPYHTEQDLAVWPCCAIAFTPGW